MVAEGGLRIMSELLEEYSAIQNGSPPGVIHTLAQTVITQCLVFMKRTVRERQL